MNKKLSSTLLFYVIWLVIVIMRVSLGTFQDVALWLILVLVALIIKDVLLYFVVLKPTKKITYVGIENKESGIRHKFYRYVLVNRIYIFPAVIIIYLIYLLIKQTHLWNLENNIFYQIINENVLLGIVIVSGILTIRKEEKDKNYQKITQSMNSTYISVALSIFLSLLGTYIIYGQTIVLGWIGYCVSTITGVLIFLIGITILGEDDESI